MTNVSELGKPVAVSVELPENTPLDKACATAGASMLIPGLPLSEVIVRAAMNVEHVGPKIALGCFAIGIVCGVASYPYYRYQEQQQAEPLVIEGLDLL